MGAFRRTMQFTKGGVLGAALGVGAAILLAPGSGDELRTRLEERIKRTKDAGEAARAQTESDLIARFRAEVKDPTALADDPAPAPAPARPAGA